MIILMSKWALLVLLKEDTSNYTLTDDKKLDLLLSLLLFSLDQLEQFSLEMSVNEACESHDKTSVTLPFMERSAY